jgi:hypothetical protein
MLVIECDANGVWVLQQSCNAEKSTFALQQKQCMCLASCISSLEHSTLCEMLIFSVALTAQKLVQLIQLPTQQLTFLLWVLKSTDVCSKYTHKNEENSNQAELQQEALSTFWKCAWCKAPNKALAEKQAVVMWAASIWNWNFKRSWQQAVWLHFNRQLLLSGRCWT